MDTIQNRDKTLDVAKGILIILVVLGHGIQYSFGYDFCISEQFFENILFKAIYSFHMPLFMMISGYLFYISNKKDFKSLAISKLKAIGIPMISFNILCDAITYAAYVKNGEITNCFLLFISSTLNGGAMWFLFSLLLNMAIIASLTRIVKNVRGQYLCMFIIFIASLFVPDDFIRSECKNMFPFFVMGFVLKGNNTDLYVPTRRKTLLFLSTICSVLAVFWFNRDTYIYTTGFYIVGNPLPQLFIDFKRIVIGLSVSYTIIQYIRIFSVRPSVRLVFFNISRKDFTLHLRI